MTLGTIRGSRTAAVAPTNKRELEAGTAGVNGWSTRRDGGRSGGRRNRERAVEAGELGLGLRRTDGGWTWDRVPMIGGGTQKSYGSATALHLRRQGDRL